MQHVLRAVSTQPRESRVWVAVLLISLFINCVQGWSVNGPYMPDTSCESPVDCAMAEWTSPLPDCQHSRCVCPSGTCVVYSNEYSNYVFFCDRCGMLGSVCSNTTDCSMDWQCVRGFCECSGSVYKGVCVHYETESTSIVTVVLVSILILVIILQNLIRVRKKLKKLLCCDCKSSEASEDDQVSRVVASNPRSDEKSAAFTIANPDFISTDEDPELAWAYEFSRRLAEGGELDTATLSSTLSSLPISGSRHTTPGPPQPSTSGWREPQSEARTQRLSSSSVSSTSSQLSSSSFDTVSSYSSTFPSTSQRPSFDSASSPSFHECYELSARTRF